jgi:hypothetical protein
VTPIDIPGTGDASPLIDGHLDRGWLTTHVHGGYATVGFAHGAVERITGFVIDCSATDGAPATADLQRFEVLFSAQSAQPGSFITGVNDTCLQQTGLQRFTLQNPVVAKYVQLQLVSNFGNPALTGVAEFEALGRVVTSAVSGAQSRLLHAHLVAHVPGPSRAAPLGRVREIVRGLGVQPPHQQVQVGKVKQPVYSQYSLHTKVAQRADVQFADGTMLYVAQSTDAVLASPSKTVVKAGVAEQKLQPGTTHRIQTSQVTADAIGTDFVTVAQKTRTVVYVVEGSVLVHNKYGRAVVKTGQYTTVDAGSAPTAPLSFSSSSTPDPAAWAASLVDPQLSENVALDANGGFIAGTSG